MLFARQVHPPVFLCGAAPVVPAVLGLLALCCRAGVGPAERIGDEEGVAQHLQCFPSDGSQA